MAARHITRAAILAQFARDIARGIELPLPEDIVALRALNAALARCAIINRCTWDDSGHVVRDAHPGQPDKGKLDPDSR